MITQNFKVSWKHENNVGRYIEGDIVIIKDTVTDYVKVGVIVNPEPKDDYKTVILELKNNYRVIVSGVYTVDSYHIKHLVPLKLKKVRPTSKTFCRITNLIDEEVVTGIAILSKKDKNYNKKIGIKHSFEDALATISSKEHRLELWEAFKSRGVNCLNC